jgi:hypothetical protein
MPPLAAGSLVMLTEPGAVGHDVDVSVVIVPELRVVENGCPFSTGVPVQRTPVQSLDDSPLGQLAGVVAKILTVMYSFFCKGCMPLISTYAPAPPMTGVTLWILVLFALSTTAFVMTNPGDGLVGAVTRRELEFPAPGVVLVALIQNEKLEVPAGAVFTAPLKLAVVGPVELTWNVMVLFGAARPGNTIPAISNVAATIAKRTRRLQLMFAAM